MLPILFSALLFLFEPDVLSQGIQKRQIPAIQTHGARNHPQRFPTTHFRNPPATSGDSTVSNSIQELAFDLAYEQGRTTDGNIVFSPLSIGALLSLLMMGTAGQTSQEIKAALYYSGKREAAIHNSYQSIIENIDPNIRGIDIKMTNQLFLNRGYPIERDFLENSQRNYKASTQYVDFQSNPYGVVRKVNDYVSHATNGKINELIKDPFSSRAVFVAVNTLFFHGLWEEPFNKLYTYNGTFFTGKSTINIPMMVNEGSSVRFLDGNQFGLDMIALPYKGGRFSMYILTPTGKNTVDNLEANLDSLTIKSLIRRMTRQNLIYTIPRMKLKESINLKVDLRKLGIASLFTSSANFEGMSARPGVFVEEIVHEALMEITETGTVAAAATAGTSDRILPKSYVFDKSSIIFIRDDSNGVILFWAKVKEPTPLYE